MASSPPRARPLLHRLRLSEYGWGRRVALIAAALVGSAAFAYAANLASRDALLQVVRVCALDRAATGLSLPCLDVELNAGVAVLRPPFGRPDTILAPTRPVVGIEDPQLQAANAPNYFALAWAARRWIARRGDGQLAEDRVALAVNSRLARSQDQLHVHMGCLSSSFEDRLKAGGLGPAASVWFRGPDMAPGLELWTYRSGGKDWRTLAPFRLAKDLAGSDKALKRMTLAVAVTGGEYVVVALRSRPGGWYAAAEDVIDSRC